MSDNDLIYRGDVREKIECAIEVLIDLGLAWEIYSPLWDAITAIGDVPTAPHEMTAREYEEAFQRITYEDVEAYRAWREAIHDEDWGRAVAIVEKWAKEHPEERSEE